MNRSWMALFAGAMLVAGSGGCNGHTEAVDEEPHDTGIVVHGWMIEGKQEPAMCARHGADRARLLLYHAGGDIFASAIAPCAEFVARQTVHALTYTATVTLLDADGAPVSETVSLGVLTVMAHRETAVVTDFAAGAFL